MSRRKFWLAAVIFLAVIAIPYLLAFLLQGESWRFAGFLLNPLDGHTYLAKMRQGWEGNWLFHLPFNPQPGEGAFLFVFYLALGHLSRITHLPLVLTFHLARLAASLLMLAALREFCTTLYREDGESAWRAFLLAAFGSGLGWAAFLAFRVWTADSWVFEAYPFLSAYTFPHFSFGLALLLSMFTLAIRGVDGRPRACLQLFFLGILLALVMPFGLAVLAVVLAVESLVGRWEGRRPGLPALVSSLSGGGLVLLQQYWTVTHNPAMAGWSAQNVLPTPAAWDLALSLSPALLLAGWALLQLRGNTRPPGIRILGLWLAAGFVLMHLPSALQRRFAIGVYIPAAVLAGAALAELAPRSVVARSWLWRLLYLSSVLTNVMLLSFGVQRIARHDPALYLPAQEVQAFQWLKSATARDAVILAAPETGLFIPGYTGRRVVYGHKYETLEADAARAAVQRFFAGAMRPEEREGFLKEKRLAYIFLGDRERNLGGGTLSLDYPVAYQNSRVTILKVLPGP